MLNYVWRFKIKGKTHAVVFKKREEWVAAPLNESKENVPCYAPYGSQRGSKNTELHLENSAK